MDHILKLLIYRYSNDIPVRERVILQQLWHVPGCKFGACMEHADNNISPPLEVPTEHTQKRRCWQQDALQPKPLLKYLKAGIASHQWVKVVTITFIITIISYSKCSNRKPVHITSLDVEKAFDRDPLT